jgi:hypothetical protein
MRDRKGTRSVPALKLGEDGLSSVNRARSARRRYFFGGAGGAGWPGAGVPGTRR